MLKGVKTKELERIINDEIYVNKNHWSHLSKVDIIKEIRRRKLEKINEIALFGNWYYFDDITKSPVYKNSDEGDEIGRKITKCIRKEKLKKINEKL